jgi:hypothetical protein
MYKMHKGKGAKCQSKKEELEHTKHGFMISVFTLAFSHFREMINALHLSLVVHSPGITPDRRKYA